MTEQPDDGTGTPDDLDLTWRALERLLAQVLSSLRIDQGLVLEKSGTSAYLQFARWPGKLVAEAVGNACLRAGEQLGPGEFASLLALGWTPPGETSRGSDGFLRGKPNFQVKYRMQVPWTAVARLAIRSLRDVYRVLEPDEVAWKPITLDKRVAPPALDAGMVSVRSC